MAFPVAAAIAYGAIAGGGLAGSVAALQRLWRYLTADPSEQDAEDERLTPFVQGIAEALARAKFGTTIDALGQVDQRTIRQEAARDVPKFREQLNAAARERFGRTFSKLTKAQKEELLNWLSEQY